VWLLCQHFGAQAAELMDEAAARTDLPPVVRAQQLGDLSEDRLALQAALAATMLPMMPDEEAAPHWNTIRRLVQKYEGIKKIVGTVMSEG
jgi:hypothetical protein